MWWTLPFLFFFVLLALFLFLVFHRATSGGPEGHLDVDGIPTAPAGGAAAHDPDAFYNGNRGTASADGDPATQQERREMESPAPADDDPQLSP
jgi:hypothetical protein